MKTSWNDCYSEEEIEAIGFKKHGKNLLISKYARIYNPSGISLGDNVRIDDFSVLAGNIEIGNYVHVGAFCLLSGRFGIILKNFCELAARVSIYSASDDYVNGTSITNATIPDEFHRIIKGTVILEEHTIIGAGSVILPSAHLMEGVAVGALSLIKEGVYDKWHLYSGIPATKMKKRPNQIILNDAKKIMDK